MIIVKCPDCGEERDIEEITAKSGTSLEDWKCGDGWYMPTHHKPGSDLICDGTGVKVWKQEVEPTLEQLAAAREVAERVVSREDIIRRIFPPTPIEDPFLAACMEIMGDGPVKVMDQGPWSADFKGIEALAKGPGLMPFSAANRFDPICVICRRSLTGTGYRKTPHGNAHTVCIDPKPPEPWVEPELEG